MAADERWPRTGGTCQDPYAFIYSWPEFAETWLGESFTFPTGRGQEKPLRGWVCSGCGRGYAPAVRECTHCPETQPAFIAKADVPDDPDYER